MSGCKAPRLPEPAFILSFSKGECPLNWPRRYFKRKNRPGRRPAHLPIRWRNTGSTITGEAFANVESQEADRRRIAVSEGSLPRMIAAKAVVQGRDGAWQYTLGLALRTVLGAAQKQLNHH